LTAQDTDYQAAPFEAGLSVEAGRPNDLPGYDTGDFQIQDPAQALVLRFIDPRPDDVVFDACAAPGGKTIALGRVTRSVIAADIRRDRLRRLLENVRRAGSGRERPILADAAFSPVRPVDLVLLDAPCLATGTMARHPDARIHVSARALERLTEIQRRLLTRVASAVRPGGLLVYATCSLEPEENDQQVERFLSEHVEFRREPSDSVPGALLSQAGDLTILPHVHRMDGAYAARLRREAR
jgi:16S rRNA (cytosine967-C5)-methyltransferase